MVRGKNLLLFTEQQITTSWATGHTGARKGQTTRMGRQLLCISGLRPVRGEVTGPCGSPWHRATSPSWICLWQNPNVPEQSIHYRNSDYKTKLLRMEHACNPRTQEAKVMTLLAG